MRGMMNRTPFDLKSVEKIRNAIESDSFKVGIKNAKDDEPAELLLMDYIGKDDWTGEGIGAKDVAGFLADNRGKPVNARINSGGGMVYEGLVIYNAFLQHDAPVTATIEGIAASIASIIAMGADTVRMSAVGSLMIHRAMGISIGNTDDMVDCADFLDKIDSQLSSIYAAKSGRKAETMMKYMVGKVDGTVFTAQEALEAKLIDEIIPIRGDKKAKNAIDEPGDIQQRLEDAASRRRRQASAAARLRVLELRK